MDNLTGDAGKNAFMGGLGNDIIDGGDGSDWVRYNNATGGVTVNLETGVVSGADGADALTSIEKVWGSEYVDNLTGLTNAWSILMGGKGSDVLTGSSVNMTVAAYYDDSTGVYADLARSYARDGWGNEDNLVDIHGLDGSEFADTLIGSGGDDRFEAYKGNDVIKGGFGVDTIVFADSASAIDVNFVTGVVSDGWGDTDIVSGIEDVIGSDNNDSIVGNGVQNIFDGGAGDDTLDGGGNNFDNRELDIARYADATSGITVSLVSGSVTGGGGNDQLYNMEGVIGTAYDDDFTGDGADTNIFFDLGGSDVIRGGSTHNTETGMGMDIVSYDYLENGGVTAVVTGNNGTNWTVTENASGKTDTLYDIDMLWGTKQDDAMTGDENDQQFMPGEGSDVIDGGGASDEDDVSYFNIHKSLNFSWNSGWQQMGCHRRNLDR